MLKIFEETENIEDVPCAEPQTERAAAGGRQRQEGGQEVSADVSQAGDAETEASGGRRRGRGRRGRAREDRRRDRAAGGAPAAAAAPRPRARAAAAGEQLPGPRRGVGQRGPGHRAAAAGRRHAATCTSLATLQKIFSARQKYLKLQPKNI